MGIPFKDAGLSRKKDKKDGEESIPFKDAVLSKRKDKETELEIEVQQCSHMVLDLENLKKTSINLGTSGATKIDIGAVYLRSIDDVICGFTEKPCVLHRLVGWSTNLIKYSHRERCPSSEGSTKKYKLRGKKNGSLFYATEIEGIEDKK